MCLKHRTFQILSLILFRHSQTSQIESHIGILFNLALEAVGGS